MKRLFLILPFIIAPFAAAKDHIITQKGKAFSESEITLAPGDNLIFKNDDDTSHNVFSAVEPMKFNLGIQKPGSEASHKFDSAGVAELRCAIHPKMKIKVTVK